MLTIKAACYKYLLDIRKTIEKYLLTVEGKIFFNMILFSVKLSTRFESKTKDWNFLKWLLDYILLACPQKIYYYIIPTGLPRWYSGKKFAWQFRRHRDMGSVPWFRKMPWRREWQYIPAFLAWESHGQRSLEGYSPWGWVGGTVAEVQILWPLDVKS